MNKSALAVASTAFQVLLAFPCTGFLQYKVYKKSQLHVAIKVPDFDLTWTDFLNGVNNDQGSPVYRIFYGVGPKQIREEHIPLAI